MNGVYNKLSNNANLLNFLYNYDIIFLSETKTPLNIHIPGFTSYNNMQNTLFSGGVSLLIKNNLVTNIESMDISQKDKIWFQFSSYPNICFCGLYILPSTSIQSDPLDIAQIQERIKSSPNKDFIIFGDWNSRFGKKNLEKLNNLAADLIGRNCFYMQMIDPLIWPNPNGRSIMNLMKDCSILPVNGLNIHNHCQFSRGLTFRRKQNWVSEIDYFICSPRIMKYINNFTIHQELNYPSNHAPITIELFIPMEQRITPIQLNNELNTFFSYEHLLERKSLLQKAYHFKVIDLNKLNETLINTDIPMFNPNCLENSVNELTSILYNTARTNVRNRNNTLNPHIHNETERWNYIMDADNQTLWAAIDWNGNINQTNLSSPTNESFADYFKKLLNNDNAITPVISQSNNHDPVTINDSINLPDVQESLKDLKDSYGPDGLSSKIFCHLPISWLIFISTLFNFIYVNALCPSAWTSSKLVTIFKKGSRSLCKNYRGISVMNSLAKLYDLIILKKLQKWFQLSREQAGCQKSRSCIEQIVTLRLIFNYAKCKKHSLYVLFIDYSAAYDNVPRSSLVTTLEEFHCPKILISAILSLYKSTNIILNSVKFSVNTGVRQGAPSSGFLFCMYLEKFVRKLRQLCPSNGFLTWLHCLLLMDDKVILATNKTDFQYKLHLLNEFIIESGLKLNRDKTKFMIINGVNDESSFYVGDQKIETCDSYCYLGMYFTSDGSMLNSLKIQAQFKEKEMNKFSIFINKNRDYPLYVKLKILQSCLLSSIFYASESWLLNDFSCMNTLYMKALKIILGVKSSTPNNVILVELGFPTIEQFIRFKQFKYYSDVICNRQNIPHDPLWHIFNIVNNNTPQLVNYYFPLRCPEFPTLTSIKHNILSSENTKSVLYRTLNTSLSIHSIYLDKHNIPEYKRKCFTNFRLTSHRLKSETGRWKIPPTPIDQRFCTCGFPSQTEEHVIEYCPISAVIRNSYPEICFNAVNILNHVQPDLACHIIYSIYSLYTN